MANIKSTLPRALLDANECPMVHLGRHSYRRQLAIVPMTHTATPIFGEDVAWLLLLQVINDVLLYFAVRKSTNKYRLPRPHLQQPSRDKRVSLCELVIPLFRLID